MSSAPILPATGPIDGVQWQRPSTRGAEAVKGFTRA
jgi:hypothetical protein